MIQPTIGYIGLGLMGSAMVNRLQDRGYQLTVMANRSRTNVDAAVERGAVEVTTGQELAQRSDIIMLCVSTSEQVEKRMSENTGILSGLQQGAVVIDFGTSLPESTRELAKKTKDAGGQYLDAPLGRTPAHAEQGLLNIMAAGDKQAYDQVLSVLTDLGENVFHLGESGAGHTIKLLNNFVGMTIANAMAEVFAVADKAGVPRQSVYDVMSNGPVHSGIMDFVKTYAVEADATQMAFSIKNAAKDVGYYSEMAKANGVPSAIAPSVVAAFDEALAQNYGDELVPKLVDFYASK